jgi:hypothetical protein
MFQPVMAERKLGASSTARYYLAPARRRGGQRAGQRGARRHGRRGERARARAHVEVEDAVPFLGAGCILAVVSEPARGTRRVRLVRGEGRGVSD